jgi:hypothetical protein
LGNCSGKKAKPDKDPENKDDVLRLLRSILLHLEKDSIVRGRERKVLRREDGSWKSLVSETHHGLKMEIRELISAVRPALSSNRPILVSTGVNTEYNPYETLDKIQPAREGGASVTRVDKFGDDENIRTSEHLLEEGDLKTIEVQTLLRSMLLEIKKASRERERDRQVVAEELQVWKVCISETLSGMQADIRGLSLELAEEGLEASPEMYGSRASYDISDYDQGASDISESTQMF